MLYIIYAHTTDYGWSFEDEKPVPFSGLETRTGLSYIFEAESMEDAEEYARKFVFYFEQEYVGEDNITEYLEDLCDPEED